MDPLLESAGTVVALVLTLCVFSYLLGDNILYRIAESIFVGVSVGYAVVITFHNVVVPKLLLPLLSGLEAGDWGQVLLLLIALLLGLLLLTHALPRVSWLGSISIAVLFGVGAALAIAGALLGTLLPQASATSDVTGPLARWGPSLGVFSSIVLLVGTLGAFLYFHFSTNRQARRTGLLDGLVRTWGGLGRWFILVAFGAILATTFMSRLSFLTGRIQFLWDSVTGFLGG
jgi:hypothetical protein